MVNRIRYVWSRKYCYINNSIYLLFICCINCYFSIVSYSYAVDLWLMYLQPWLFSRSSSDRSFTATKWQSYIAANLHYYTTLLCCFLHGIARVDLLPSPDVNDQSYFRYCTLCISIHKFNS